MIYPIHFFNPNISVTIRYCLLLNMLFRMLYWLLFNTSILKKCLNKEEDVEISLKNNLPIDMIELDIKGIWEELGKINGSTYEEELLDEMFKRFCLGK